MTFNSSDLVGSTVAGGASSFLCMALTINKGLVDDLVKAVKSLISGKEIVELSKIEFKTASFFKDSVDIAKCLFISVWSVAVAGQFDTFFDTIPKEFNGNIWIDVFLEFVLVVLQVMIVNAAMMSM